MVICDIGPHESMTMPMRRDFSFHTYPFNLTREQPREVKMNYHQDKLSFFIIIKEGLNTKHLKIPSKFLKHLNEDISRNAFLIGPSSNKWHVTIFKKGNDMYMLNGWPQFLSGNSVNLDEFLLFKYHGENCFKVQIFSKNGCERLYHKDRRQEEAPPTPRLARTKKARPTKSSNIGSSHLHKSKPSQGDLSFSNKGSISKDYPKPKIDRSEACKLAESVTSGKPYLIHLLTKSNVEDRCLLPIATEFARKYITEAVKMIILWNTEGKYWEVTVTWIHSHSQNKRYSQFTKGWGKFVRDNKLKRGDTCIFELEEKNHLKVHIVRCPPN